MSAQAVSCPTRSCASAPCSRSQRRAAELNWHTVGVTASPLPGPSGNVEYFLHLRARPDHPLTGDELEQAVERAVVEGPQ